MNRDDVTVQVIFYRNDDTTIQNRLEYEHLASRK